MESRRALDEIATRVLDAAFRVHSAIGCGLLERAYEHCLAYELTDMGMEVARQVPLALTYRDLVVHDVYRADLIVERAVLFEIKATELASPTWRPQVVTYLRCAGLRLGYVLNFGSRSLKYGIQRVARHL